ncbi:MAG: hypothetical protein LH468_12340 [Nocardioides sp.]|nr:hypothetical protein [Nocardioides sp.]
MRLLVEHARGLDVVQQARGLRAFWEVEGGVAISSAAVEIQDAGRRRDPQQALSA